VKTHRKLKNQTMNESAAPSAAFSRLFSGGLVDSFPCIEPASWIFSDHDHAKERVSIHDSCFVCGV
jgi:hypothetical protein